MIFLFPQVGYVNSLEGIQIGSASSFSMHHPHRTHLHSICPRWNPSQASLLTPRLWRRNSKRICVRSPWWTHTGIPMGLVGIFGIFPNIFTITINHPVRSRSCCWANNKLADSPMCCLYERRLIDYWFVEGWTIMKSTKVEGLFGKWKVYGMWSNGPW